MLTWAEAIEASPLGVLIRQSTWAFALGEVVHLFGLTLVLGTTIVLNLRLFGWGLREQSPRTVAADLRTWNAIGLALSVCSGIVLSISEAVKLAGSPPFAIKMALFAMAVAYTAAVHGRVAQRSLTPGFWERTSAAISLALWFGVATAGRAIAFY